ncbi:MAG: FkbM family methyltransferase [Actinobacteria bacterium]|nr:FkbM family methyltransferase [Actinomycetota bacterium]
MSAAVGVPNTIRILGDRARGQRAAVRHISVPNLHHPIRITGELSDLEMLAEARLSPIYRQLPMILGAGSNLPIIDVGANIGTTATLFASMFKNANITAVEPFERNREVLEQNLAPYGSRARVIGKAVTATGGTAFLVNPEAANDNEYCGLRFDGEANEAGEAPTDGTAVEAMTLNELLETVGDPESIGVFKLDVEGGERELASAGLVEVLKRTRCFVVETHDRYRPGATDAVRDAAASAGLRFIQQHQNDYFFVRD